MSGENKVGLVKADALLSDKFVEYSERIKELFDQKKTLTEEFKKTAETFKTNVLAVEAAAEQVHFEFQQWQEAQAAEKAAKMGQKKAPQN